MMIRQGLQWLWDLLYPRDCVCLSCSRPLVDDAHRQLCQDCLHDLQALTGARCPVCSRPVPSPGQHCLSCVRLSLDTRLEGTAAYLHQGTAQKLVHHLKFNRVRDAAIPLAMGMLENLPTGMDALTPIPLHPRRERERGFNQSALLCDALSEWTDLPILNALTRPQATREQSKLKVRDRWQNTHNAFALEEDVRGQRILLVDDVRTTGSTALACANVLYLGGAREVRLLTATLAKIPGENHA